MSSPALPTYRTVAGVLEREKGSGIELAGWTILRTGLISIPMLVVGVDAKKAFLGGFLSSMLISTFTLLRIYNAKHTRRFAGPRRSLACSRTR